MKIKAFITTALVCCFVVCMAAVWADMNGKWTGVFKGPDGTDIELVYNIKVDGNKLTGDGSAQGVTLSLDSGMVSGTEFKFSVKNPEGVTIPHTGKYFAQGDSISMTADYQGFKMHSTLKRSADK